MNTLKCNYCDKEYKVSNCRLNKTKFCSRKCSDMSKKAKPNLVCTFCKKSFYMKESRQKRHKRTHGYFCSVSCVAEFRKEQYLGENNPNFRTQVTKDKGYTLAYLPKFGRIKLHHKVVFETLGISKIPNRFHVHHRDCDVNNNSPENLVLLSPSDHKWLHKQFGNATLWAYMNNKISLEELANWSNNKQKAETLLPLSVLDQKEIGVFKSGELLENPEEDNQQPSY